MTTIRSCPSIVIADGSGDDRLRTGRGGVDTRFLDLKLTSSSMFDGMKVVTTCMLGEIDGVPPAWLEPRWSIGQVAARTGVPADTLRYYEHVGAVIPAGRTSGGPAAIATSTWNGSPAPAGCVKRECRSLRFSSSTSCANKVGWAVRVDVPCLPTTVTS